METITKIPGLQHISEDIFKLLNKKSLMNCRMVNSSWKNVLNQPMFWLKKLNSPDMPLDVQRSWENLVDKFNDEQVANELALIMSKIFKRKQFQTTFNVIVELAKAKTYPDLMTFTLENENPCSKMDKFIYIPSCTYMQNFKPIHLAACFGLNGAIEKLTKSNHDPVIMKEMYHGQTPIHLAALNGQLDTVKYLVSFTDVPIARDDFGNTPIHSAANNGHLDVVKFLVDFTDTPNTPNNFGSTPCHEASRNGHLNVVTYLMDYTDAPMTQDNSGDTPIHEAASNGHLDVVKFLVAYTDTPNITNNAGHTPIQVANMLEHVDVENFLKEYCKLL